MNQTWEEMMAAQKEQQRIKEEKLEQLIKNGGLKEWADRLTAEGKELKMTWDGGGDSGWVDFVIDDAAAETDEDKEYAELLRDMCYEELDYGSWAGEFSASGECVYNPTEGAFVGTDHYSEDDTTNVQCELTIEIPADVWFDSVEIMIQDEEVEVSVDLVVRNGFKTQSHDDVQKTLEASIKAQVHEIIDEYINNNTTGQDFRSMWEEINLSKSDFILDGNVMKAALTEISLGTWESEEKDIVINLDNEDYGF